MYRWRGRNPTWLSWSKMDLISFCKGYYFSLVCEDRLGVRVTMGVGTGLDFISLPSSLRDPQTDQVSVSPSTLVSTFGSVFAGG